MVNEVNIFGDLAQKLDDILNDTDKYSKIYEINREKSEEEIKLYTELKDKAVLGEKTARNYLINLYTKLMSSKMIDINQETVNELIDFKEILNNSPQILFEMLLEVYDMSDIIKKYNFKNKISESDIKEICEKEKNVIAKKFSKYVDRLKLIAIIIYAKEYGQDCVDTLSHHNINEIGIIDKDYVYIVHRGEKVHLEFLKFENKNIILNIQKKTTSNGVVNFDKQNPTLVTSKNNSSRITVAGYDSTPGEDDLYYNERIFNLKKITLEEMRDNYKTINQDIYEFLCINQKGRGSHYVTGADMGVGKSTFLLAMMEKIPDMWGIGILDTQNELQARKKYSWKNILTLIENPKRSISECFEIMLKMSRDVIVVGEITKPSEVAEQINASLRLNAGVGGTMHSLSAFEVVTNIRNLMMRTNMYQNAEIAEADIARGLDLIIHLCKLPNGRIVVENIVEVVYVEQDKYIKYLQEGSNKEKIKNILNLVQLALQKYLYKKSYRYNEIFRYDMENDRWHMINKPSNSYFEKISKYVDEAEIEDFKRTVKCYGDF